MDIVKSILEEDKQETNSRKSTEVHKDVELSIDVGSLLASDYNNLDLKALRSNAGKYLKDLTRDNVQLLVNKIWELPTEHVEEAIVAKLPKPQFVLPRARCLPKPKPLTKWQQFAKEKGIRTKKKGKSKLKWDEELQKWIPTYGYKRAKAVEQKEWLVEVGKNSDPTADTFAASKQAKEERRSKNELQRLRNIARAKKIKIPKVGLPTAEHFPNTQHLSTAITVARTSTASVGKFQDKLPKEKDAKGIAKEVPGMKRKSKDVPLNSIEEKRQNKNIVENILKNNKKILREDFPISSGSSSQPAGETKKKNKVGKSKNAKKPKAGKGKRNIRTGGRKRK